MSRSLGRTCLIRTGDMAGFYLRAEYDEDTGGYYVYYSRDFSDLSAEGYDEWYPTLGGRGESFCGARRRRITEIIYPRKQSDCFRGYLHI